MLDPGTILLKFLNSKPATSLAFVDSFHIANTAEGRGVVRVAGLGLLQSKASKRPQCGSLGCGTSRLRSGAMNSRRIGRRRPWISRMASIFFVLAWSHARRVKRWHDGYEDLHAIEEQPLGKKTWSPVTGRTACFRIAIRCSLNAKGMQDHTCCHKGREALTVLSASGCSAAYRC